MTTTTDTTTDTEFQHPRERVDWRLPAKLERDLEQGEGLPSEKWQNNLRDLLDNWAANGGELNYDPADDKSRMCGMYVASDTVRKLEAVAERLARETGKKWSTAAVVRLVWEQERGR